MSDRDQGKPDTGWVRYLGILTTIGLVVLLTAEHVLPRKPAAIVGALAFLMVFIAGAQFLYLSAVLASLKLEGQQRKQFQVLVSLVVPVLITVGLASRADAVPLETLWRILTPWLLVPLGIIAWIAWYSGKLMNREHPFRAFVIAAGIFGVLCFLWSTGMTSDSDYYGEGSNFFLDEEKAKRARETGEYVWKFLVYVAVSYMTLFASLRFRKSPQDEAFLKLNETLTPAMVQHIVSKMGGYIADRKASPGRESDLPFPKAAIELAFLKAIRDCPDGEYREALKSTYVTLDDFMLSHEDCEILTRYQATLQQAESLDSRTLAERLTASGMDRALEIMKRLTEAMRRRNETLDTLLRKEDGPA